MHNILVSKKPAWTKNFENFLLNYFSKIKNITVFGSLKTRELGYGKCKGQYYLLSDIDLHSKLCICRVKEIILGFEQVYAPNIKFDISNVYDLDSPHQRCQRLGLKFPKNISISNNNIVEAICIRLFYSILSMYESKSSKDWILFCYSIHRLISELPMYTCWKLEVYKPSYFQQLIFSKKIINNRKIFREISNSVFAKSNLIELCEKFDEKDSLSLISEKLNLLDYVFSNLDIKNATIDKFREIYEIAVDNKFYIDRIFLYRIWSLYSREFKDGVVREKYLKKRIENILSKKPNKLIHRTKIPPCFIYKD